MIEDYDREGRRQLAIACRVAICKLDGTGSEMKWAFEAQRGPVNIIRLEGSETEHNEYLQQRTRPRLTSLAWSGCKTHQCMKADSHNNELQLHMMHPYPYHCRFNVQRLVLLAQQGAAAGIDRLVSLVSRCCWATPWASPWLQGLPGRTNHQTQQSDSCESRRSADAPQILQVLSLEPVMMEVPA